MTEAYHNLATARRELQNAKDWLLDAQLTGLAQITRRDHIPGHVTLYPGMTFGEFYQLEIDRAQYYVDRWEYEVRFERVMSRWTQRRLDRMFKRPALAPASTAPPSWLRSMGVDDAIIGRRIADCG